METNYLKWNAVNWVTVVLMVSVAYIAYGFISKAVGNIASRAA